MAKETGRRRLALSRKTPQSVSSLVGWLVGTVKETGRFGLQLLLLLEMVRGSPLVSGQARWPFLTTVGSSHTSDLLYTEHLKLFYDN
jgi:hypothetical protein